MQSTIVHVCFTIYTYIQHFLINNGDIDISDLRVYHYFYILHSYIFNGRKPFVRTMKLGSGTIRLPLVLCQ